MCATCHLQKDHGSEEGSTLSLGVDDVEKLQVVSPDSRSALRAGKLIGTIAGEPAVEPVECVGQKDEQMTPSTTSAKLPHREHLPQETAPLDKDPHERVTCLRGHKRVKNSGRTGKLLCPSHEHEGGTDTDG